MPDSQYKNKIVINNINFIVPNMPKLSSSFSPQLMQKMKLEENAKINKNEDLLTKEKILIIIKNKNFKDIELQVKFDDYIRDVIEEYKTKLQNDKINNIAFKNEYGNYICSDQKLHEAGISNMSTIYAEFEEERDEKEEKEKENVKNEKGLTISQHRKEKLKKIIKQKLEEGLITIQIYNSSLGTDFYFVNPKVKFQVVAEEFYNKYPGRKWYFIFGGKIISTEETLEKLNIKMLSKILVEEYLGEEQYTK